MTTTDTPIRVRPGTTLRTLITVAALGVLVQAVLAGQIIAGTEGARVVHGIVGQVVAILALAQLVVAVIQWRRGTGTGRMAALSAVVLVAVVGQLVAGSLEAVDLHVPLGVAIFGGYVWLLRAAWR